MSAITTDWTAIETVAPTRDAVRGRNEYRREVEFRLALDRYIADYEKAHAATIGSTSCDKGTRSLVHPEARRLHRALGGDSIRSGTNDLQSVHGCTKDRCRHGGHCSLHPRRRMDCH